MYPAPFASYVLLERLGAGGMSEVDLARRAIADAGFVRLVVIKRIKADHTADSSFINMFKDEARITSELNHDGIGRVYDFGREGDEYYLVLEYVPGVDLRQLISELAARRQRVPLRVALGILVRVLEALDHAHNKRDALGRPMNVVHRDVNPRNVMLSVRGDVKLIDFGVALATDRLERTRTDHVKGKFSYMAPEQISGEKVDHRADLYAAGLTLHELLTAQGPFSGLNQIQILHRMMSGEIPKFPSVPELGDLAPLRAVHTKALQKDRNLRYQSATAFRDALLDVLAPLGGAPTADELADFLRRTSPEIVERIEAKIEDYSVGGVPAMGGALEEPSSATFPGFPDGTLEADLPRPTERRVREDSATRLGPMRVVAGGLLVGVIIGVAILVLASGIVVALGWRLLAQDGASEVPAPLSAPVSDPVPTEAPRGVPGLPNTQAEQERLPPSVPAPPSARPSPSPVAPPPAPDLKPEPSAAQPVPATAPVQSGTVQIRCSERGLPIQVDGQATAWRTPGNFPLAEGDHEIAVEGFPVQRVTVHAKRVLALSCSP